MKRKMTLVLVTVLLAALLMPLAACSEDAPAATPRPTLVMATNAMFPPFEFINDNGEFDGFDVHFARAIAAKLGMDLRIEDMLFEAIIAAVQTGDGNMVGIAAMTDRADRRVSVDFTVSYFQTELVVIVTANSAITSPDQLHDKRIAVQEGTTSDLFIDDELPDAQVARFKAAPDTVLELTSGRADAIIIDRGVAEQFISQRSDIKILPEALAEEVYAIAVKKGNAELLTSLNRAIQELKNEGVYQELYDRFFGGES